MNFTFLFPGQGSQIVGMGKDLCENFECARNRFKEADTISGRKLAGLIFNGPMETLTATENTQPALFTVEAIIVDILAEKGVVPAITAGHSLGEYGALYAAGVLSFEDGLKAVLKRGALMAEAGTTSAGTMAAIIGLEKTALENALAEVTDGVVVSANENAPIQTVISGDVAAVQSACEKCKAAGARRAVLLPVSGAFHSPLMESAAQKFADVVNEITFTEPQCPVICNVSAAAETDPVRIKELLLLQLTSPVRWVDSMAVLNTMNYGRLIETGPGTVLKGLVKKCSADMDVVSCGRVENIDSLLENEYQSTFKENVT
jgi:[acyl-carrier-protein] S-malonyltransferase